jgi:hypothetical protein
MVPTGGVPGKDVALYDVIKSHWSKVSVVAYMPGLVGRVLLAPWKVVLFH